MSGAIISKHLVINSAGAACRGKILGTPPPIGRRSMITYSRRQLRHPLKNNARKKIAR
jgi:hypothetical protein